MNERRAGAARSPATDASAALLAKLVSLGVHDIVLAPGSRSQAPALIAEQLERAGIVRLHVRIDERVAGFTALGLARESGRPVVVICTSGTAVANLLPVAVEAHHAGVPLLLVTGDRPPELRGIGANQTTRQHGLFGPFTRFAIDAPVPEEVDDAGDGAQSLAFGSIATEAFEGALGAGSQAPGPAHVNLPLRDPLAGELPPWFEPWMRGARESDAAASEKTDRVADPRRDEEDQATRAGADLLDRGPRTVVIAGADAGEAPERIAFEGGWPLIAEIVSGARYGRHLVHGYRDALDDPALGGAVERAVVYGHPTLSREVVALLSRDDVEVIAVRGPGEQLNLNGATLHVDAVAPGPGAIDRLWLGAWLQASRELLVDLAPSAPDAEALASADPSTRREAMGAELGAIRQRLDRAGVVDAVWRATWPHDRLVFGSSRLVRVADAVLGGKKVPVHANRGVAGIDGTIATALGVAIASQAAGAPGVTRVVLGDLTFLHDVGALLLPPSEQKPRIQLVVGNDGGGTIFDGLEVARVAGRGALDRVLYTPQSVDIEHLASAYGWEFHRVTTRGGLDQLLSTPAGGMQIIEVPLARR